MSALCLAVLKFVRIFNPCHITSCKKLYETQRTKLCCLHCTNFNLTKLLQNWLWFDLHKGYCIWDPEGAEWKVLPTRFYIFLFCWPPLPYSILAQVLSTPLPCFLCPLHIIWVRLPSPYFILGWGVWPK